MQYNLTVSKAAEDDILAAFLFYEQRRAGLGLEFSDSIKATMTRIESNPLSYGFRYRKVRGCVVKQFPFIILFYVRKNEVRVISVFHTSRKPH